MELEVIGKLQERFSSDKYEWNKIRKRRKLEGIVVRKGKAGRRAWFECAELTAPQLNSSAPVAPD